ncbi:MAG: lipopolysaccharide biosynthesis protein [Granulosicoccus sp.]
MLSHLRNYASAGVVTGIVGLISFPILTRSLTVAEYGIVGLITSTLTLFVAIGKFGLQHAVIRFYSQVRFGNIGYSMGQLNSTVSVVFFVFASMTTLLWLVTGILILPNFMQYEQLPSLFKLAAAIVFIRLSGSAALNFLRAQQHSGDVALSQSLARCLNLFLVLLLFFYSELSPTSVISCLLIAEIFSVGYAFYCYSPSFQFRAKDVSSSLAKTLFIYGLPLMILESLELVLRLSDRYMIESMIGASALGQYSASYNLTTYIDIVILYAMVQTLKPAYLHMWEEDGKEVTQAFLSKFFRIYLITFIPFITIFALTAPHLLRFLAGDKYAPGTVIIPYLSLSYLMMGAMHILTAGIYIFKDTKVLVIWSSIATVTNLLLNLFFIPIYGIVGASAVTVISFGIFTAGVSKSAFRNVDFPIDLRTPGLMALFSLTLFFVLDPVEFGPEVVSFLVKGAIGVVVLVTAVLILEPEVKTYTKERFAKVVRG